MLLTIREVSIWRKVLASLLAVALLLPGIAVAQEKQISEIKVAGNERVSNDAILAAVALQPGTPYSEKAVEDAKQSIEKLGYFDRVLVGTESMDSGVRVVFNVVENPVVKEIKVAGNTAVETEKLRSLMRTTVGGVLNVNTLLQQDVKAIEAYYDEQGYIAYVTEEIGIDRQTGMLTVPILEVKVENIRVTGNKKTKTNVILREMDLKPGDVFNRKVLFNDIRRVYDLDIFDRESAEPYKLEPGTDLGNVIVTIPVKERKTGEISVGLGYSSQQKLVGTARLSEANFRGRAQTVNLTWEQSGSRGSSFEVGFFEPWLDTKHTSIGVNVYNKRIYRFTSSVLGTTADSTEYDERRKGGSVTLSRPFGQTSRGFVTFRTEAVDTDIEDDTVPLSVINQNGTVTSGTFRFTNSSRDSELDPLAGAYNSYAVEVGNADFAGATAGDTNTLFTKYSVDLRRYFSKGGMRKELNERRKVLAVRMMAGSLTGNVPFFEQYFVGGAETLRSYREDRFWGKNMLVASVEYRVPLAPSLTGVIFADYGDAWGAASEFLDIGLGPDFEQHDNFSPSLGFGPGIRVITPIGPLRLDYGFGEEGSRAHFSIGHVF